MIDWRDIAINALLELQWWRQEYGERPISRKQIIALLQPIGNAPSAPTVYQARRSRIRSYHA